MVLQAANALRICLAYWILSKGFHLRAGDVDVIEALLGSPSGSVLSVLQQSSGRLEEVTRQIRNALYDGLFGYVLNLANKSVQVWSAITCRLLGSLL